MKKYALLLMICTVVFGSGFASAPGAWDTTLPDLKVVSVESLTQENLREFGEGKHPELAVEFPEKTRLPVRFLLGGDLIGLVENGENGSILEINRTLYARCAGQEWILSEDAINWKSLPEFITGTLSVTLIVEEGKPSVLFGSELNRRS